MNEQRNLERRQLEVELTFLEAVLIRLPERVDVIRALADLYTKCGRIQEGLRMDETLCRLLPDDAYVWYNMACSYALNADKTDALDALEHAVYLGYCDVEWLMKDNDLDAIREEPRYQQLMFNLFTITE